MGSYKHPDCGHVFIKRGSSSVKSIKGKYKIAVLYKCKFCGDSRVFYRNQESDFTETIYSPKAKSGHEDGGKIVTYYTPGGHSDYNKNSCFAPCVVLLFITTSFLLSFIILIKYI